MFLVSFSKTYFENMTYSYKDFILFCHFNQFKRHHFAVYSWIQIVAGMRNKIASSGGWTHTTMSFWVTGNSRRVVTKPANKNPFGLRNFRADADPEQHDVFYTNMAPVVEMLRAMGALPIRTLPVHANASSGNKRGKS
jgi:hypothetical protein